MHHTHSEYVAKTTIKIMLCYSIFFSPAHVIAIPNKRRNEIKSNKYVNFAAAQATNSHAYLTIMVCYPGHIRVKSGSDPDCCLGHWVIRVSSCGPVSTLIRIYSTTVLYLYYMIT